MKKLLMSVVIIQFLIVCSVSLSNIKLTNDVRDMNDRVIELEEADRDYYTKSEVDDLILEKLNESYTKEEIDLMIDEIELEFGDYYRSVDVDNLLKVLENKIEELR